MSKPLLEIWNNHTPSCGEPPIISNRSSSHYYGFFQNRFDEQWVLVYDREKKQGELRGGDLGWDTIVPVKDGRVDIVLGKAETAWLQACLKAATFAG